MQQGEINASQVEMAVQQAGEVIRWALVALFVNPTERPDLQRKETMIRLAVCIAAADGKPMPTGLGELERLQMIIQSCQH